MPKNPTKQRLKNYISLFSCVLKSYYKVEKKRIWLIQFLMLLAFICGAYWILSVFLGVSFYQNPQQEVSLKQSFFLWLFKLPTSGWILLTGLIGMFSALTQYLSIKIGVTSSLRFQKHLHWQCLQIVTSKKHKTWPKIFANSPRAELLKVLKMNIQLCGLVARRMARAMVSVVIFIVALTSLILLDSKLLLLMLPLALCYFFILFIINQNTKQISAEMTSNQPGFNHKYNRLVDQVLNKQIELKSTEFKAQFEDSQYISQAQLRYQRRLAEIHVDWLNTLFLIFSIGFITFKTLVIDNPANIDWNTLLLFLVALKFASDGLSQIAATSVAFSRFYPEIKTTFELLNHPATKTDIQKLRINENCMVFLNEKALDFFALEQFKQNCDIEKPHEMHILSELRNTGVKSYFQHPKYDKLQIILSNHLNGCKQFIKKHSEFLHKHKINQVIVMESPNHVFQIDNEEFLHYQTPTAKFADDDLELLS